MKCVCQPSLVFRIPCSSQRCSQFNAIEKSVFSPDHPHCSNIKMPDVKQTPLIEPINNGSAYKCWPAIRNEYRKHAYDAYCEGDMDRAILYDSKSLSCSFVGTQLNAGARTKTCIDDKDIDHTIHLQQNAVNPLVDFISECLSDIQISSTKTSCTDENHAIDEQRQIDDLYDKCANLPTEWNVIQITQMHDGYDRYATKKHLYNGVGPIVLTLFRYNLSEQREDRALYIVPDTNEINSKNVSRNVINRKYSIQIERTEVITK